MRAVVLLSGGLDSATTLGIAQERGFSVSCLSFDYGQRHRVELDAAREVAAAQGVVDHRIVRLDLSAVGGSALTDRAIEVPEGQAMPEGGTAIPVTYVPARNTVFLAVALGLAETVGAQDLFFGANALDYSGYPDCRPAFVEAFERLAQVATKAGVEGQPFRVHAPLMQWTKAEIVREAARLGVDLSPTVSCYDPRERRACGRCDACRLRRKGFAEAGVSDPTPYAV
ncbi:MAG TPA: 7-cyano-7-deazaguanine synthase QueC [Myxococcales bacterium LLY-WYZ-16_1]|nr:7-cyano-7-deazaguanine synthase QueC [Myxococcales bacterium LLY-WYZ-16_1]